MRVTPGRLVKLSSAKSFQVVHVARHDMHHEIVAPGNQQDRPHLGDVHDLGHEAVHRPPVMLGQLDQEQRLEPNAHCLWVHIGARPAQHAVLTQTLQAFMGARRR